MKKILLSMIGVVAMMSANAATPETTSVWSGTINKVALAEDCDNNAKMAFTGSGETYVAGVVSGDGFTLNSCAVTPVGVSSYLAKYDAKGAASWAVVFSGAASVTALTADAEGNVYVAGKLADEVTFSSKDGSNPVTVGGYKDEFGEYTEVKKAAFIAKYDANGVLKTVNTYIPAMLPGVASGMELATSIFGFGFYDENLTFQIDALKAVGDKIYVGALFTGATKIGDVDFVGAFQNLDGWMFVDLLNSAVFTLDTATLQTAEVLFSTSVKGGETVSAAGTTSIAFDVDNGTLYCGAIVHGSQDIMLGKETESKDFTVTSDGVTEYSTVMASVNISDKISKACKYYTISTGNLNKDLVSSVIVDGGNVYVGGLAHTNLSFDSEKAVKGHGDIYVASLKAEDFSVNWTVMSGIEEGTGTDNGEVFVGMGKLGSDIVVAGYSEKLSDHTAIEGINGYVAMGDGTLTLSNEKVVKGGFVANGTLMGDAVYTVDGDAVNVTYNVVKVAGSAINNVVADANAPVKFYNLQGVEVTGENLPAGIYVRMQGNKASKVLVK